MFAATAGFADEDIDLTSANSNTQYDISKSGDVRVTGNYNNDSNRGPLQLVFGEAYQGTITLDAVNILETSHSTGFARLFFFANSSETPSVVIFSLSGDSTITSTGMTPIAVLNPLQEGIQNELVISGTGRLTVTVSEGNNSYRLPAIGPVHGDARFSATAGSISIEGGYVVATGRNAPAIGDYSSATDDYCGQRITISGGVIEAKTNSADIPAIGMRWDNDWLPTYIIGGSVSADKIADPINENETELSRFDVDYGIANAGKSYTFTVNAEPASYDYTFTVPDDGIAWLWVPEANSGDIPPVPAVNAPKLAILAWFGEVRLSLDMSGVTATEYKWFRATSEDGEFQLLGTTDKPSYVDKVEKMGITYWYYAEADGIRSDTKSITPQSNSSSSNCNAGFGALAFFGLLAPSGMILQKRG
ncbi:hypothetical protein LJC40_05165 [Synergistaceae bacterium OttesenSCG-928-D05]|nr:hypothetical protein [Synergistaceae bacterium OttesenSCG-928-D05]